MLHLINLEKKQNPSQTKLTIIIWNLQWSKDHVFSYPLTVQLLEVLPWHPTLLNPNSLGIRRVSWLPSSTFASKPEKPFLVSSWSSTICPV